MRILKFLPASILLTGILPVSLIAQKSSALPHILVYKTKKDYSKNVMIELSPDKKHIMYYPAPSDMDAIGKLKPVQLHKGYMMSKAGVSTHTAYLNITMTAYSKLKEAPSEEALLKMVKDKSPVTELCDCGKRGGMTEQQINDLIDNGALQTKCKKIK